MYWSTLGHRSINTKTHWEWDMLDLQNNKIKKENYPRWDWVSTLRHVYAYMYRIVTPSKRIIHAGTEYPHRDMSHVHRNRTVNQERIIHTGTEYPHWAVQYVFIMYRIVTPRRKIIHTGTEYPHWEWDMHVYMSCMSTTVTPRKDYPHFVRASTMGETTHTENNIANCHKGLFTSNHLFMKLK